MDNEHKAILKLLCEEMNRVESLSDFTKLLEKHGLSLNLLKHEETDGDLMSVQEYLDSFLGPLELAILWKGTDPVRWIKEIPPIISEEERDSWGRSYVKLFKKRLKEIVGD